MERMNTILYFWRGEKNQEALIYFLCVFGREICWEERKNCLKKSKQLHKP